MAVQEHHWNIFAVRDSHRMLALEVEGQKFWVPRDTMAVHSPVFRAMLYGDFSEAKKDVIPLPGKKAENVEEVLRCLIPMPVCKEINRSNLKLVLDFADEYEIKELRRRAETFLAAMLEKCSKGDGQLLYILPLAANWRMKILQQCLDRCVEEFDLATLLPIFKDLPEQVKTYLALGRSGCRMERTAGNKTVCSKCSKQNNHYNPRYYAEFKCAVCGEYRCNNCNRDTSEACAAQASMNGVKMALLDSISGEPPSHSRRSAYVPPHLRKLGTLCWHLTP